MNFGIRVSVLRSQFKFFNKNQFFFGTIRDNIIKLKSPYSNANEKIIDLAERQLLLNNNHPLGILKNKITHFFQNDAFFKSQMQEKRRVKYGIGDNFSPIVSTIENFDELLVPKDHVSRKRSDTYYINENTVLCTHATAHEKKMFLQGHQAFTIFTPCFRRDEIDATHYPVFHQMEAVRAFKNEDFSIQQEDVKIQQVMQDLQSTWEHLVKYLFGDIKMRWVPAYFPFTEPSLELEIFFRNQWMEMLGCGILRKNVMKNFNRPDDEIAWASGCGLERFAMLLFDINDIRMFWSTDQRFLAQYESGKIAKFQPFSKYPSCYKDLSFWIADVKNFEPNDLFEIIRHYGGDLIEKVELVDKYEDKKKKRTSQCFRIHYRSLERTLKNEEIDSIQFKIRDTVPKSLNVQLR